MAALVGLVMLAQGCLSDEAGSLFCVSPAPAPVAEVTEAEPEPLAPWDYLYATYPRLARRLDCVIARESHWNAGAYNPRSGAAGLAQFLLSTWYTTPQGKAGGSRYDPYAAIDGAAYLILNDSKSWRHWVPVLNGAC